MNNQQDTSINALRARIFSSMDYLQNDSKEDLKDKLEKVKQFSGLAKEMVETYKVEVSAMGVLSSADSLNKVNLINIQAQKAGIFTQKAPRALE